jgi:NhaA family Na+:H+ antiporter
VIHAFFKLETASGLVLLAATIAALAWANLGAGYDGVWQWPLTVGAFGLALTKPLILWINDFLMAVFFLLVGLELKREMVSGELSSLRQAVAPAGAALGGMIAPAVVFLLLVADPAERPGWAVPMATDIAFALGCLRALGRRAPLGLLVFLTAVAVVDDLGAIVVIALFYTSDVSLPALAAAAALTLALAILNGAGARRPWLYLLVGLPLWVAVLKSGIHATLAGVIVGLAMPADRAGGVSPTERLEHALHPWVAFGIIPLFALANAGVVLDAGALRALGEPLVIGIAAGLFVGKQIGVFGGTWLVVRTGIARLPDGLTWRHIYGAGLLAGIGFTMALFIASLAFAPDPALFARAKIAIVSGSVLSALAGVVVLAGARPAAPPLESQGRRPSNTARRTEKLSAPRTGDRPLHSGL